MHLTAQEINLDFTRKTPQVESPSGSMPPRSLPFMLGRRGKRMTPMRTGVRFVRMEGNSCAVRSVPKYSTSLVTCPHWQIFQGKMALASLAYSLSLYIITAMTFDDPVTQSLFFFLTQNLCKNLNRNPLGINVYAKMFSIRFSIPCLPFPLLLSSLKNLVCHVKEKNIAGLLNYYKGITMKNNGSYAQLS